MPRQPTARGAPIRALPHSCARAESRERASPNAPGWTGKLDWPKQSPVEPQAASSKEREGENRPRKFQRSHDGDAGIACGLFYLLRRLVDRCRDGRKPLFGEVLGRGAVGGRSAAA